MSEQAETTTSTFAAPASKKYPRISENQANLRNANNQPWYLDVDYAREVGFEEAFASDTRAA